MNSSQVGPPPSDYDRRLFPTLIGERAKLEPTRPFAAIPKSSELRDGFVDVSYHQLARAIDRCSWWLEHHLGKARNFETVGYLSILDLRYTILMFACVKVGYKAFFSSPRNSLHAHLTLLEQTECNEISEKRQMKTISFPELDYFLQDGSVEQYPYHKSFAEARLEPLVVLHTSGSNGIPKPVIMAHGTLSWVDAYRLIPSLGGREVAGPSWEVSRLFLVFPIFHVASMCYLLGLGIYCGITCVLPPSGVPLDASVVDKVHIAGNVQGLATSLLDLLFDIKDSASRPLTKVYHIANSFRTSWSALLPSFTKHCSSDLEVVALAKWIETLQQSSAEGCYTPAVRLLGFFERFQGTEDNQVASLDTTNAQKVSKTLAEVGPVNEDWVKHWMELWGFWVGGQGR